jgi:hypothetical protein
VEVRIVKALIQFEEVEVRREVLLAGPEVVVDHHLEGLNHLEDLNQVEEEDVSSY